MSTGNGSSVSAREWTLETRLARSGVLVAHLRLVPDCLEHAPPSALQQQWLTQDEIEQMRRFRQFPDQWRMLAGRALLRGCLSKHFGVVFADFVFGEHNKPMLAKSAHTVPVDFNLTHDQHHVIAAFSAHYDVGVDVACVDDFRSWEEFAGGYLDPREISWVRGAGCDSGPWRALRLWTLKEAILKSTGHGLDIDPRELVLAPDSSAPFVRLPDALPRSWAFRLSEWRSGPSAGAALTCVSRTFARSAHPNGAAASGTTPY